MNTDFFDKKITKLYIGDIRIIIANDKLVFKSKSWDYHTTFHLGPKSGICDIHSTRESKEVKNRHTRLLSIRRFSFLKLFISLREPITDLYKKNFHPLTNRGIENISDKIFFSDYSNMNPEDIFLPVTQQSLRLKYLAVEDFEEKANFEFLEPYLYHPQDIELIPSDHFFVCRVSDGRIIGTVFKQETKNGIEYFFLNIQKLNKEMVILVKDFLKKILDASLYVDDNFQRFIFSRIWPESMSA